MLRRGVPHPSALLTTAAAAAVGTTFTQARGVRYGKMDTFARELMPGRSARQISLHIECGANPDAEDERRFVKLAPELAPKPNVQFPSQLAREYTWGRYSQTMFLGVNESPGPWWNAHETTFSSLWSNVGITLLSFWCGITSEQYGGAMYNVKPYKLRGRALASKDAKSGAMKKDYKELDAAPATRYVVPHTKEHVHHRRIKNPALQGETEITTVEAKRVLREVQYHFGTGISIVLTDGYFGSHPDTASAYRILSDSVTHGYVNSLFAIRNKNIVDRAEMLLSRRVSRNAIDEWAWRRPGIVVYQATGFQFETPRVVEEFGGPRPVDLGIKDGREKFIVSDPYAIPMKGLIAGEPSVEAALNQLAFYAGRWGFYADDKEFLTIGGDAVLSPDGSHCTVLVHDGASVDVDKIRGSAQLYGARHFRLARGLLSRGWDMTTVKAGAGATPRKFDFVEESRGLIHRPLPLRVGAAATDDTLSHRFTQARQLSAWGFKRKHSYASYSKDAKSAAAATGNTFNALKPGQFVGGVPRPSAVAAPSVSFVIVSKDGGAQKKIDAAEAAKRIVQSITAGNWLYAEPEKLEAAFARELATAGGLFSVGVSEAAGVVNSLATKGTL